MRRSNTSRKIITNNQINLLEKDLVSTSIPFRYPGSKMAAAKYFVRCFPPGITEIVSPFFGGGSFELFLSGRDIQIHGSDLFEPLVNLWNFILTDNKRLAIRSEEVLLSLSRNELKEYQNIDRFQSLNQFDQAAYLWLFYCLSWNGVAFSGLMNYVLTGRNAHTIGNSDDPLTYFHRLETFKNHLITVDLLGYEDQLKRFPDMFAYLDPPYPDVGNLYGYNLKSEFQSDFNHEELRDTLKQRDSLWMLSYNDKPIILDLYSGSDFIVKYQWWKQGTQTNRSTREIVIFPKEMKKYIY